jgi:hypothetical protein
MDMRTRNKMIIKLLIMFVVFSLSIWLISETVKKHGDLRSFIKMKKTIIRDKINEKVKFFSKLLP